MPIVIGSKGERFMKKYLCKSCGYSEELKPSSFVLQRHYGEKISTHYDVRISEGFEFNIYGNPATLKEGESFKSVKKEIKNVKVLKEQWMTIDKAHTFRLVGPLATYVDPVDKGSIEVIEHTPEFVSMKFHGSKITGYFVYRKNPEGEGRFEHSKLPEPKMLSDGNPNKGPYSPFQKEQKQGWDYYWLNIYDMRTFSRCVADPKEYLKDITIPDYVFQVLVCLYPRPGTLSGARVSRIKVKADTPLETASSWIISNKLHTWQGSLIRHERKNESLCGCPSEESIGDPLVIEYWKFRVNEYLGQRKTIKESELEQINKKVTEIEKKLTKSQEDEELDRQLKKEKIELLKLWRKAQEG